MEEIEAGKASKMLGSLLERVRGGESFVLTRYGRRVAVLAPLGVEDPRLAGGPATTGPASTSTSVDTPPPPATVTKRQVTDAVADPLRPGRATVNAQAERDKLLRGVNRGR